MRRSTPSATPLSIAPNQIDLEQSTTVKTGGGLRRKGTFKVNKKDTEGNAFRFLTVILETYKYVVYTRNYQELFINKVKRLSALKKI